MKNKQPKNGCVEIHRTRTKMFGGTRNAYRVKLVGANGEILQTSEAFNDKKAVHTHIKSLCRLFGSDMTSGIVIKDMTKDKEFEKIETKI